MTTAVKRACDACHRRKVKCDGINPCRNCSSANLGCTYNAIPQKKGPKGSRAKVISELRENQRQTSLSARVQNRMNGVSSPPTSPSLAPNAGMLSKEMVNDSIEFFFNNMYPVMPVLSRQMLEQQIPYMESNIDAYCLFTSLCALMLLQPGMNLPGSDPYGMDTVPSLPGANIVTSTVLMEETLRVRKGHDYLDSPTLNTLCTSYFLFACHYGLEMHEKAWYYLREATTLMHMNGMNKEEHYHQYEAVEASRRRRLYWLFFATERAYALQRHRPLTLQATINLPTLADDPSDSSAHRLNGFFLLINVFRPFDDTVLNMWNKTRSDCSSPYLIALGKQLGEMLPAYKNRDAQMTDLARNQQWLKNLVWQFTAVKGMTPNNDSMSFQYPMETPPELLQMASSFAPQGMESNVSMIEKLLEVSASLTDVLALQPAARDPFTLGPREHLDRLLDVIAVIRTGEHRFVPLMFTKVHEILPRLTTPILLFAPENACNNLANIDIFDGFGNAGMAQLPVQDFDRKFASRMDESSGASANGLNSPFITSPSSVMSPTMEFPAHQGMQSDFMSDMVMNPMSQGMPGLSPLPHTMARHGLDHSQPLMSPSLNKSINMVDQNMMMRPQVQRSNSFAVPPTLRGVGSDFSMQRHNTDLGNMSIPNMSGDMDFNTMR